MMNAEGRKIDQILLFFSIFFVVMEAVKQVALYQRFGYYNVWYVPFQLCSMPIYLCVAARLSSGRLHTVISTFLVDYGILGGIAALLVHDGFTFPDAPLLTAHGYIWHIAMLLLAAALLVWGKTDFSLTGYVQAAGLFLLLAAVAFLINVALHSLGDCDMFYISPYHLSSQPVFHDIDAAVGRSAGIFLYLFAVCFGAGIVHGICGLITSCRVR